MTELWIVEARSADGALDFAGPQPDDFFGPRCATGMTDDQMAKAIFHCKPDATLSGDSIPSWPRQLDPRFSARRKTW